MPPPFLCIPGGFSCLHATSMFRGGGGSTISESTSRSHCCRLQTPGSPSCGVMFASLTPPLLPCRWQTPYWMSSSHTSDPEVAAAAFPRSSCRGVAGVQPTGTGAGRKKPQNKKRRWSSRESSATSRRQGGVNATRRRATRAALALNINGLFLSTKRGGRASGPVDRLAC